MKLPAPKDAIPLSQRTADAYKELAESAATLNAASDELGKVIEAMDISIQRLNVGVEAWVNTDGGWENQNGEFEKHLLGYAKVDGTWGIALRIARGFEQDPETGSYETWLFNDAPRVLRVDAVEKLPELLDRLKKKAESTSRKLTETTAQARELASALKQAASEVAAARKK